MLVLEADNIKNYSDKLVELYIPTYLIDILRGESYNI